MHKLSYQVWSVQSFYQYHIYQCYKYITATNVAVAVVTATVLLAVPPLIVSCNSFCHYFGPTKDYSLHVSAVEWYIYSHADRHLTPKPCFLDNHTCALIE